MKDNYVALRINDNGLRALNDECEKLGVEKSRLLRLALSWLCGYAPKEHRAEWRKFVRNAVATA